MKNITVSIPDRVYRRARIKAAERDLSVNDLVRESLLRLGEEESDFGRRKRLQARVLATIRRFRASDRLTRDELHRRREVREPVSAAQGPALKTS